MKEYSNEVKWEIHDYSHRVFFGLVRDILNVADLNTLSKLLPVISRRLDQVAARYDTPAATIQPPSSDA